MIHFPANSAELKYSFHPVSSSNRPAATRACCSLMNKSPGGCPGSTEGEENPALQFLSKLLACSWWVFVELHSHLRNLAGLAAEWLNSSERRNSSVPIYCTLPFCSKPLHEPFSRGISTREEELSKGKVSIITTFCFSSLVLSDSFWEA